MNRLSTRIFATCVCAIMLFMIQPNTLAMGQNAIVNKSFEAAPAELQEEVLADKELTAAAKYAYMDIETADEELKDVIVEARKTIIYSQSWTVDGASYLIDPDGNVITLPEFSYLFPGWEVPSERASETALADIASERVVTSRAAVTPYFNGPAPVPAAVEGQYAPFFAGNYHYSTDYIETSVNALPGDSVNLGYAQLVGYDFVDKGYVTYKPVGYVFILRDITYGGYYTVRASTFSTTGTGYFWFGPYRH